jgi:DNA-binding transcriptional LysR family regulator
MIAMDRLQAMTTFVRIVEKGSLTAAAEAMETSLPSVVRALAALERDVGVRLLNRTTRRMRLTEEGALYLERCRSVLQSVQELGGLFSSRQAEPQGRLAVTASVLFGRRYIAPVVADFIRRFPGVNVDLLLLDRVVSLVEEGVDVGVRIGHLGDSSLVAIPVGKVRRVVCASPRYLQRHGTPLDPGDIQRHRCVRFSAVSEEHGWKFSVGRKSVIVPVKVAFSTNQVDAAVDMCVSGLGLGMFLSYQVAPHLARKALRYVLESFEPEPLPVNIVYPHARLQSTRVRAFVDQCVETLRNARLA